MKSDYTEETTDEAARQRRFHEHVSVLAGNLNAAYMAAGKALTRVSFTDHATCSALGQMMEQLAAMETTARTMRDEL